MKKRNKSIKNVKEAQEIQTMTIARIHKHDIPISKVQLSLCLLNVQPITAILLNWHDFV